MMAVASGTTRGFQGLEEGGERSVWLRAFDQKPSGEVSQQQGIR